MQILLTYGNLSVDEFNWNLRNVILRGVSKYKLEEMVTQRSISTSVYKNEIFLKTLILDQQCETNTAITVPYPVNQKKVKCIR